MTHSQQLKQKDQNGELVSDKFYAYILKNRGGGAGIKVELHNNPVTGRIQDIGAQKEDINHMNRRKAAPKRGHH